MVVKVFFKEDMYVHCFFKQNAATLSRLWHNIYIFWESRK